jgi:hypothetical protein
VGRGKQAGLAEGLSRPCDSGRSSRPTNESPDLKRSGLSKTPTFDELLIDLEDDKAARAVVFGLLREMER